MKQRIIIALIAWVSTLPLLAQSTLEDDYQKANEAYEMGRFEMVDSLLATSAGKLKKDYQIGAYRLLVLSSLYQDKRDKAEEYVNKLLAVDPYYSTYGEAPRFVELLEQAKTGKVATITTASQQAESIEEAPVPVTLITEEMIRNSNARNLQELLLAYVPGMSVIEGEEANLSMRGTYSYSMENILVMLNGVRLNSYTTNSVAPDYRFMLENIKQIEVLRGSASSLYGSVSLSAVINIITKEGRDVDGFHASAGFGSMHTFKANALWGKRYMNTDIMVWGSLYQSRGYRHDIPVSDNNYYGMVDKDAYSYVNGFNGRPAYNIGMTLKWNNFNLQLSRQHGKRVYTYCNMLVPSYFSYDEYQPINSMKPGRSMTSTIGNLNYTHSFRNLTLSGSAMVNLEEATLYNIVGDTLTEEYHPMIQYLGWHDDELLVGQDITLEKGVFQTQNWKSSTIAAELKAIYDYKLGHSGHGNILVGLQYNYFDMYYNDVAFGDHFNRIIVSCANDRSIIFSNHSETGASAFAQIKHHFNKHFLFNGGLRYDFKNRYVGSNQRVLSPRISLIWNQNQNHNFLLSYAKAYEDAPYFYRASKIMYIGNEELLPEYMDNVQLAAYINIPSLHLKYEGNIFYTNVKDIITLDITSYVNSGRTKTLGMEHNLTYHHKGTHVIGNVYLQRVLNTSARNATGHTIYAIPNFTARLNVSQKVYKGLTVNGNLSFSSSNSFYIYNASVYQRGEDCFGKTLDLPAVCLINLGARYDWQKVSLMTNVNNVFNTIYRLGGDRLPIYQEGRTAMATLSFKF